MNFYIMIYLGTCEETHDNAIYGMTKLFIQILDYMDLIIEKDKKGDINYTNYDLPKFVMYSVMIGL